MFFFCEWVTMQRRPDYGAEQLPPPPKSHVFAASVTLLSCDSAVWDNVPVFPGDPQQKRAR